MSWPNLAQYVLFLLVVTVLVQPVGSYMARVFEGHYTWLDPVLRPAERKIYTLTRVDPTQDMPWPHYAGAFLVFSLVGTLLLYGILRLQPFLPYYDAAHQPTPLTPDLAANTALSFVTTTTWQAYAGESTMSYVSQIVGLAAQNFLAGAAGLAVGIAFIRGFAREHSGGLGNFWVDLVRSTLWVLLPLSIVGSIMLVWQGVPLNFRPYTIIGHTLSGGSQTIAQGPVAALEFIKNLGTNGGGFFNANGAHPYENPTPLTNVFEMLAIVVLPAALTATFGRMTGRVRQGWVLFGVMAFLFVAGLLVTSWAEHSTHTPLAQAAGMMTSGNVEGKETRFGVDGSVLTEIVTSNGATGSTNSAPDSYTPIGGTIPLVNMLLGEMIFGGLGTGMYSILKVALVALFITGLMIGRTPEYMGKQIGPPEIKLIMLYTLVVPVVVLPLTALAAVTGPGLAGLTTNNGAHGLTEMFFAYTSSVANNGQTFGGLSANSPFYNATTAIAMMVGRFGLAIPALGLAGRFAQQGRRPASRATFPIDSLLFAGLLVATALIVTGLSYFPALALGPIVEHLQMVARH